MLRVVMVVLLPLWLSVVVAGGKVGYTHGSNSGLNDVSGVSERHVRLSRAVANDSKIVGGNYLPITSVPYQAFILVEGVHPFACGGSILNRFFILTAAHCLTGVTDASVRVGSTNSNSGGTVHPSDWLRTHPQYNLKTFDYDVGLIKLKVPLRTDGEHVEPVKLADEGTDVPPGIKLLVSGWGLTKENGAASPALQAARVAVVANDQCRASYSDFTERKFCAGNAGKDTCEGDSGGPAVTNDANIQVGIVSSGAGCARAGYPGLYTKVSAVRKWIHDVSGV